MHKKKTMLGSGEDVLEQVKRRHQQENLWANYYIALLFIAMVMAVALHPVITSI